MTKARDHMERVASLGCAICSLQGMGYVPAEAHHIGDTSDRDDFLTIPLCPTHHRGSQGFHHLGERRWNATFKTNEQKLLAHTLRRLA